jgi:hypothetical protein
MCDSAQTAIMRAMTQPRPSAKVLLVPTRRVARSELHDLSERVRRFGIVRVAPLSRAPSSNPRSSFGAPTTEPSVG